MKDFLTGNSTGVFGNSGGVCAVRNFNCKITDKRISKINFKSKHPATQKIFKAGEDSNLKIYEDENFNTHIHHSGSDDYSSS